MTDQPATSTPAAVISTSQCHTTRSTGHATMSTATLTPQTAPTQMPTATAHNADTRVDNTAATTMATVGAVTNNPTRALRANSRDTGASTTVTTPGDDTPNKPRPLDLDTTEPPDGLVKR